MASPNLLSPEFQSNPYPILAELRRHPVCQVEPLGMWALSRYDEVQQALRDPRFSNEGLARIAEPEWLGSTPFARSLVTTEPPRHPRLRGLISRAFGVSGMARLEALVRRVSAELAEEVVRRREVEFVDAFAVPLPRAVIGHMLGLDPDVYPKFKRWSLALTLITGAHTPEMQEECRSGLREMEGYLNAVIESRRQQPREDMVSDLLRAEVDGQALTHDEILSFLCLLLPAGLETTSHLLGNTLVTLSKHPHVLEQARADPARIPGLVEEVLRYEGPVKSLFRLTLADVELGGARIPAGSMVQLLLASANRDETKFERADEFLPGREKQAQHLAFGYGHHFCLGAQLARMEARLGLEALLPRVRGFRLPPREVAWLPGLAVRGPQALPVEFLPA